MDHRVWSRGSGCPVHKKQLLPVLIVWAPPRKKRSQEQHALNGNTSASAASSSCGTIPGTGSKRHSVGTFRGAAALDPRPRMSLGRKTSVSPLQNAHQPAETCDARYLGREDVHHEFDCAGALRELLQKGIALLRVQLAPTESEHGFGGCILLGVYGVCYCATTEVVQFFVCCGTFKLQFRC